MPIAIFKGLFSENVQILKGLSPSSDLYNTDPDTDVFNMSNFEKIVFLLIQKTGGTNTGTANIKAKACTSVSSSNAENVVFKYQKMTTGASDAIGDYAEAVAGTGLGTTANEDTIYVLEVHSRDLPATKKYVYLDLTETVNDPVLGCVVAFGVNPDYGSPFATALT